MRKTPLTMSGGGDGGGNYYLMITPDVDPSQSSEVEGQWQMWWQSGQGLIPGMFSGNCNVVAVPANNPLLYVEARPSPTWGDVMVRLQVDVTYAWANARRTEWSLTLATTEGGYRKYWLQAHFIVGWIKDAGATLYALTQQSVAEVQIWEKEDSSYGRIYMYGSVAIYGDDTVRAAVVEALYKARNPGGFAANPIEVGVWLG